MNNSVDFKSIFESMPGLYLVLSPDFTIQAVSDDYLKTTLAKREELVGKKILDVFIDYLIIDDYSSLRESLNHILQKKEQHQMPFHKYDKRHMDEESEDRFMSPVNKPVLNSDNQVEWIIHYVEDVTAITKQDKLLKQQSARLNLKKQDLEMFRYSVSHDLRTPIRAMDIYIGLLSQELENSHLLNYVNQIEKCTIEMNELIKSLMDFIKISKAPVTIESIDLNILIELSFNKQKKQENAPNTKLTMDRLPFILADNKLMGIAVNHLVSNAIKYSATRKKPLVEVGYTESDQNFVFYIKDNGVGFNPKLSAHLFKPFSRLHSEDEFKGTGAGLAIVERILRKHNGTVYAESEIDQGATFYFTIPKKLDHILHEKEAHYH